MLGLALPAQAQETENPADAWRQHLAAPPASPWRFDFELGSDNRSKGASKSDGEAFASGAMQWSAPDSGLYVRATGETLDHSTGADIEGELLVGWETGVSGFDLDLSAAHKWYFNADPATDDDAWEFTADVSRELTDAFTARLRFQYSPDSGGSTRSWTWVEVQGAYQIHDGIEASAAVGRREQVGSRDYTAWNVGAEFELADRLSLDLRWYDTDVESPSAQYDEALVAVLRARI